jgi:hypothetical protein
METLLDLAFMVFALGFFKFSIQNVNDQEDKHYSRKLNDKNSKR